MNYACSMQWLESGIASTDMNSALVQPLRRSIALTRAAGTNWLGYLVFAVAGFLLPRLVGNSKLAAVYRRWVFPPSYKKRLLEQLGPGGRAEPTP